MLFNALSKLMCILSEGTNIQNGKVQSLHLLQRQIVKDTEARRVTLERPDNLRVLGRRSVAEVGDVGEELLVDQLIICLLYTSRSAQRKRSE